jgi:hypothetical protein
MSTLGGMIRYAGRSRSRRERENRAEERDAFKRNNPDWLPRNEWEAKLRREGKWKDYK